MVVFLLMLLLFLNKHSKLHSHKLRFIRFIFVSNSLSNSLSLSPLSLCQSVSLSFSLFLSRSLSLSEALVVLLTYQLYLNPSNPHHPTPPHPTCEALVLVLKCQLTIHPRHLSEVSLVFLTYHLVLPPPSYHPTPPQPTSLSLSLSLNPIPTRARVDRWRR